MLVEYGKLKMFLVTLQGVLTPFSMPVADGLPHWLRFAAQCLQGGSVALFMYLLKPASQLQPKDILDQLQPTDPDVVEEPPAVEGKTK